MLPSGRRLLDLLASQVSVLFEDIAALEQREADIRLQLDTARAELVGTASVLNRARLGWPCTDGHRKGRCGMASQKQRGSKNAAPGSDRAAPLAEGESLVKAHERLRLTPANDPAHAAHRERLRIHHGRVRSHFLHRRDRAGDT
jgi:hypothetical protein